MLCGIDPVKAPILLYTLAAMGHGDEIVIADARLRGKKTRRSGSRGRA